MANILYDALFGKHAGCDTPFLWSADGSSVTYAAFLEQAAQFAHVLTDAGLNIGDRVAIQIDKSGASLAIYAACVQAGFVFLPLNTAYTADEVQYFVENSGARVFVCDPANSSSLQSVADGAGAQLETLDIDGVGSFADKAATKETTFATVDRSADDLAAFLYTSGTTGRSKGAMLSHKNLLSNSKVLADLWQFTSDDVLLHALPIFHTHGLFVASNITLLAGGSMIFLPKFDVDVVIEKLPQATAIMGVPTFYTRLLSDERFTKELASKMRLFVSGSAPLLAETHVAFEERTGHRILERYGMTETNMNTT
ncbi:MAG: AMP-binding protein, partial [Amylibacter sp.]